LRYYSDLHLHSRYSRATSKDADLEHLAVWAQLKGIHVVGTGDFTHPTWFAELQEKLEPVEEGLFQLKSPYLKPIQHQVPELCRMPVRFMLTVEISNIYKKAGKVRKIHHCVFVPSFRAASFVRDALQKIGNIQSDGRPILGMDSRDLLEIVLESDPLSYLIPAHIWTPWFSVLGSKGGFDRMEDCFEDLTEHIFAVETGLSSDPSMNWRVSQLDQYTLVSNGDAHSPSKLGREATIFDTELSYPAMYRALKDADDRGLSAPWSFFRKKGSIIMTD
jgi:DNA helicase II / ATP-dependent DNA helicase PcrA